MIRKLRRTRTPTLRCRHVRTRAKAWWGGAGRHVTGNQPGGGGGQKLVWFFPYRTKEPQPGYRGNKGYFFWLLASFSFGSSGYRTEEPEANDRGAKALLWLVAWFLCFRCFSCMTNEPTKARNLRILASCICIQSYVTKEPENKKNTPPRLVCWLHGRWCWCW
jgi:hypothetical protein